MKTMTADERGLTLSIVLPIADHTCKSAYCEKVWLDDETANELENSACTEEEKVAVEQLAELRRIRDLSMQEDADECSCSTERSFNTYDERVAPSLTSSHVSHTCDLSMGSPAASTSAACNIVDIWNLNHKQEQQKQLQSNRDAEDEFEDRPGTRLPWVKPNEVDDDDDGRPISRSRLLSELYRDQLREPQPSKASKRRRKAMTRIMEEGHSHGNMNG